MVNSAVFVGLTAGVEKDQIAVVTGVSAASAIFQSALRANLHRMLARVVNGDEVRESWSLF